MTRVRTHLLRTAVVLGPLVLGLVGCGSESPAPEPTAASAPVQPEGRPGEAAIVGRSTAAQAEVTRLQAERERVLAEAAAPDGDARRLGLRRVVELDHELGLALLARDEAELDFYALACAEAAGSIGESHRAAAEEERRARAAWLEARLAAVDADVALTALVEDEQTNEAEIERAAERAAAANDRRDELEEPVSELSGRRVDLRLGARSACDERLPASP